MNFADGVVEGEKAGMRLMVRVTGVRSNTGSRTTLGGLDVRIG